MRRLLQLAIAAACCGCPPPATINPPPTPTMTAATPSMDTKPQLEARRPYRAPEPVVYQTEQGTTVWLIQRPSVPIVSISLTMKVGSADDPPDKGGLAHVTAAMLDEGAGARDAIQISTEIQDLGASLHTHGGVDGSRASLSVMSKHLDRAFPIFADVIARPTFAQADWARVSELWHNQLRRRVDNPRSVARVVRRAVVYGPDTPYGHSPNGDLDSAKSISRDDVEQFYARAWRPDRAHLIVAGDIDRARLDALLAKHLGSWTNPKQAPTARVAPQKLLTQRPHLVLVDRPDAPQAIILLAGKGVAADNPHAPLLELVNTALGGSFTSRLNQNLREDHAWTYGARSAFLETRGVGTFIAQAAVFSEVTAAALGEMLRETRQMAAKGLTADELYKVRARDLTDLIETHETIDGLVGRLGSLAILGLPHDFDAKASTARQAATAEQLADLAKQYLKVDDASIIVVGPRDQLLTQLRALNLGEPQLWSAQGRPLGK